MGRREKRKASEPTLPTWACKVCGIAIFPKAPSLCYECMFTKEEPAMSAFPEMPNMDFAIRESPGSLVTDEPGVTSAPTEEQKNSSPDSDAPYGEDKTFTARAKKEGWFKDPNIPSTYYLVNLICNLIEDEDEVHMDNELRLEILKELDDLLAERHYPSSLIFNALVGHRVDDMTARFKIT
jgi:hypothetical protein